MIKRLKYHEIDFEKYSKCIENSAQKNFYAQKEILDLQTKEWETLVMNDYEYVMPIPIQRKMQISFVEMPLFVQQLGIFGKDDCVEINELFLSKFQKEFPILSYSFNHFNHFETLLYKRKNYVVLKQNYDSLFRNFSKGRKSVIKSISQLKLRKVDLDKTIQNFINEHFKGLKNKSEIENFQRFIFEYRYHLTFIAIFFDEKIITLGIINEAANSFGLLALINDKNYKIKNGATFLVNEFLKSGISNKSFDFMGGNIRGIEIFFKSFGAELYEFPIIQNSKIELAKQILKKLNN